MVIAKLYTFLLGFGLFSTAMLALGRVNFLKGYGPVEKMKSPPLLNVVQSNWIRCSWQHHISIQGASGDTNEIKTSTPIL